MLKMRKQVFVVIYIIRYILRKHLNMLSSFASQVL